MKIRCIIGSAAFAASLACSGAWAWDQDPAAQYFERKDTIVSGAGDARNVNAATHIIDPWPRYVGNRRIPATASGWRGRSNAIARTRRGPRPVRLRRYLISRPEAYLLDRTGVAPIAVQARPRPALRRWAPGSASGRGRPNQLFEGRRVSSPSDKPDGFRP